jgi:chaperonin GroES
MVATAVHIIPSAERGVVPMNDGVTLEMFETKSTTQSGLHLPGTAVGRSNEAIVVAVGPGRWEGGHRCPIDLKEGDRVLFLRWSGYAFTYEGRKLVASREGDIICVVDKEADVHFEAKKVE